MQFILPSRFNIVKNANQCTTGVNVLVPEDGVTKAFKQYLETAATEASSERMATPSLHKIRICPYSRNNFTPDQSAKMPFEPNGMSHCVYGRVTPMLFRSTNFKENLPYTDYLVLVNAILIAARQMQNKLDWHKAVEDFYDWSRLRELHIDFKGDLVISRCTTVWKTVKRIDIPFLSQSLLIECSNPDNIQSRLDALSTPHINAYKFGIANKARG